jgi:hypothetical protein
MFTQLESQCADGLVCLQRDEDEQVPGCTGSLASASDYCVRTIDMKVVEISGQVNLSTVAPTEGEDGVTSETTTAPTMTGTMSGTVMDTTSGTTSGSDADINADVAKL